MLSSVFRVYLHPGVLEYLVKADELDDLSEYLSRYDGSLDIVLDNGSPLLVPFDAHFSEVVWPHPVRLFPYE